MKNIVLKTNTVQDFTALVKQHDKLIYDQEVYIGTLINIYNLEDAIELDLCLATTMFETTFTEHYQNNDGVIPLTVTVKDWCNYISKNDDITVLLHAVFKVLQTGQRMIV